MWSCIKHDFIWKHHMKSAGFYWSRCNWGQAAAGNNERFTHTHADALLSQDMRAHTNTQTDAHIPPHLPGSVLKKFGFGGDTIGKEKKTSNHLNDEKNHSFQFSNFFIFSHCVHFAVYMLWRKLQPWSDYSDQKMLQPPLGFQFES